MAEVLMRSQWYPTSEVDSVDYPAEVRSIVNQFFGADHECFLGRGLADGDWLVSALVGADCVAYASAHRYDHLDLPLVHLDEIVVDFAWRRRGIGRLLLVAVAQLVLDAYPEVDTLTAGVKAHGNERAARRKFFLRAGFVEDEDGVWMVAVNRLLE